MNVDIGVELPRGAPPLRAGRPASNEDPSLEWPHPQAAAAPSVEWPSIRLPAPPPPAPTPEIELRAPQRALEDHHAPPATAEKTQDNSAPPSSLKDAYLEVQLAPTLPQWSAAPRRWSHAASGPLSLAGIEPAPPAVHPGPSSPLTPARVAPHPDIDRIAGEPLRVAMPAYASPPRAFSPSHPSAPPRGAPSIASTSSPSVPITTPAKALPAAPSLPNASAARKTAGLVIEHLDVEVVMAPPPAAESPPGRPTRGASARTGALRMASRYYLGRY
jgi:hypothetical protein